MSLMNQQRQLTRQEQLEQQLNGNLSRQEQCDILNSLGIESYLQTQYYKSIQYHTRVLKLTINSGKDNRLIAFRSIGENYRQLKKFKKGFQYCQQHLELSEEVQNELETQRALCNMGLLYMDQADWILVENKNVSESFENVINLAIDNLIKSQQQVKKVINLKKSLLSQVNTSKQQEYLLDTTLLRLQQIEAESIYNQANALSIKARWDNAHYEASINKLKEAASLSNSIKYQSLEGKCYNTLGLIYLNQKNYQKSLKCYLKDAEICEKEKDVQGVIETYISIGILQQGKRDYSKSREYFNKALGIAKKYKMSEMYQKVENSLDNLKVEVNLREECSVLEAKLKKINRFNEGMSVEYCDQLLQLEEFEKIINFALPFPESLKMMQYKAIAEGSLKKYNEAKESYEKVLKIQSATMPLSIDYANNLIEYSNVLDELHSPFEEIEKGYLRAYEIAENIDEFFVMKVALENLDILYEAKKLSLKRKDVKKKLNKFLAQHPEMKISSAQKENGSLDEEEESEESEEGEDCESSDENQSFQQEMDDSFYNDRIPIKTSRSNYKKNNNNRSQMEQDIEDDENEEEEEDEQEDQLQIRNLSSRKHVNKKNFLRICENKRLVKVNENLNEVNEAKNNIENNQQNNQKNAFDLFSMVQRQNQPLDIQVPAVPLKKKAVDAYKQKCLKIFMEPNEEIVGLLSNQNRQQICIKKRYFDDLQLSSMLKSLKYLNSYSQLQLINLSYNLLSNNSLYLLKPANISYHLHTLNISFNCFIYDESFAAFLQQLEILSKLNKLDISGLAVAQSNQDDCWHQLFLLKSLKILKFKYSALTQLPSFLPLKIQASELDSIILKGNSLDSSNTKVLSDILAFRNITRFDISDQISHS